MQLFHLLKKMGSSALPALLWMWQGVNTVCAQSFIQWTFVDVNPCWILNIKGRFTLALLQNPWTSSATCEHSICQAFWIIPICCLAVTVINRDVFEISNGDLKAGFYLCWYNIHPILFVSSHPTRTVILSLSYTRYKISCMRGRRQQLIHFVFYTRYRISCYPARKVIPRISCSQKISQG